MPRIFLLWDAIKAALLRAMFRFRWTFYVLILQHEKLRSWRIVVAANPFPDMDVGWDKNAYHPSGYDIAVSHRKVACSGNHIQLYFTD